MINLCIFKLKFHLRFAIFFLTSTAVVLDPVAIVASGCESSIAVSIAPSLSSTSLGALLFVGVSL